MRIKNGELMQAKGPLAELVKIKFPVKTAFALARMARKIEEYSKPIEECRDNLIRQYGDEDEPGHWTIKPNNSKWQQFAAEFNELMEMETEIVLETIPLPDCTVAPEMLIPLEKFVSA